MHALQLAPEKRILVVDDDREIREELAEILQLLGFDVGTAENGVEALAWLRQNRAPDVIVLDVMMPTMSGGEFRSVQLGDPELASIPVIVFSACEEARQRGEVAGAHAYLEKPLPVDALLAAIAGIV